MQSGGFSPSSKVPKINSPALVLWGRQDGILDGTEFANKVCFVNLLAMIVGIRYSECAVFERAFSIIRSVLSHE